MGNLFSAMWDMLVGSRTYKIVVIGLNNAGKTSILYALQLNKFVETQPTIGGTVEELSHKNVNFLAWDLGGQEQLRESWSLYYQSTDAVIFVVDSSEPQRFSIAKKELHKVLAAPELSKACILIFANKQDVQGALPAVEVAKALGMSNVKNVCWTIQPSSAVTLHGLHDGLSWVVDRLMDSKGV